MSKHRLRQEAAGEPIRPDIGTIESITIIRNCMFL